MESFDRGSSTNQLRLGFYWASNFYSFRWQLQQVRRGLFPTLDEAAMVATVRNFFTSSHSFEGWWGGARSFFLPEFVDRVEEQRSKAA